MDAASMCQPGESLKIRLQAMNRDDGVELYGPWSHQVEYPCSREGTQDVRVHVTVEFVHTFRIEMAPLPYATPLFTGVGPVGLMRSGGVWPWPVRHRQRHHFTRDRNVLAIVREVARRRAKTLGAAQP